MKYHWSLQKYWDDMLKPQRPFRGDRVTIEIYWDLGFEDVPLFGVWDSPFKDFVFSWDSATKVSNDSRQVSVQENHRIEKKIHTHFIVWTDFINHKARLTAVKSHKPPKIDHINSKSQKPSGLKYTICWISPACVQQATAFRDQPSKSCRCFDKVKRKFVGWQGLPYWSYCAVFILQDLLDLQAPNLWLIATHSESRHSFSSYGVPLAIYELDVCKWLKRRFHALMGLLRRSSPFNF